MDKTKKLHLGPLFMLLCMLLWAFRHGAAKPPTSLRLYFFNLIPLREMSFTHIVSDHPALHKPGLVERKSV